MNEYIFYLCDYTNQGRKSCIAIIADDINDATYQAVINKSYSEIIVDCKKL